MNNLFAIEQMHAALELAQSRRGFCAPNPAVGSVIADGEKILAKGAHFGSGHPHAEIEALKLINFQAHGATLYVTLEPCCHYGKTPPCTEQIIKSGVKTIYFGLVDPNPKVAGQGITALKKAGIVCHQLLLPEIQAFYESYIYWTRSRRPFVTAKLALSLDGKIAGAQGAPVAMTGLELKELTHHHRLENDAILTTINTIINDDPQLNVRLLEKIVKKPIYILDSNLRLPLTARIFQTAEKITVFHASTADASMIQALTVRGVSCKVVGVTANGLDLKQILSVIGEEGVHDLWIEAGGKCFQSFLQLGLLNRALLYIAPQILGKDATSAFTQPFSFGKNIEKIQWISYGIDCVCDVNFKIL